MQESMFSIFVAINVKPEHREAFVEASIAEARGSIQGEPGLFQFQILADESDQNRFYFYEIFRDENAAKQHWETNVFKTWWNTVEGMIDGEIETISKMRTIFPSVSGLEQQKPALLSW